MNYYKKKTEAAERAQARRELENAAPRLATEVPAFVAFYRAAADFTGTDEFELEISFFGGHKQIQHIRVSVSSNPTGAKGI